ncbi:hypothetical protein BG844_05765 [Couchioplanes caeruleus subsp. caeruleus]|uniref:2'-5' RNA ligase n=2 Tax=Couchioplanes caeruleus TaxID=56438 RepID=A0A1K0H0K5_9ACTN|nr:hypothetical protein BG844_05765 [Couchioplanes caeruleus subsp. caeruleus]
MAAVVPAHVTVAYPEEIVDEELFLRRAQSQLGQVAPFRLRLGEVFAAEHGRGGVFLAVNDIDGGWSRLRRLLLTAPMTALDFPPHVTMAHPRTCTRGEKCHRALAGQRLNNEFRIPEVLYTETTADTFTILRRFRLATTAG